MTTRFDAPKYPSVSWGAIRFITGAGAIHKVRLLDHMTVVSGSEAPASLQLDLSAEAPAFGIDYYHAFFLDTRYTVAHTDCIRETQLTRDVQGGGETWMYIGSVEGCHIAENFAAMINDPTVGDIRGRYGPCQATVITAEGGALGVRTGPGDPISSYLRISFKPDSGHGKLGNLDRVLATCRHSGSGELSGYWLQSGAHLTGGDTDKKYRITLDFTEELRDKQSNVVPMNDCRKIYMVFAPRFERIEEELEDGCFLTADAAPGDSILQVDDTSKLSGGR